MQQPETAYSIEDGRDLLAQVVAAAEQKIKILSYDLDPAFYNQVPLCEQLTDFILASRYQQVQILIQEPRQATDGGHYLIELGKRLSSKIQLRRPAAEHRRKAAAQFLLADDSHVFYREFSDSYKTQAYFDNSSLVQTLVKQFKIQWLQAESHPDLRFL